MNDFVVALGLVLVIEGMIYALFPNGVRRMADEIPKIPDSTLRVFGLAAICIGFFVVWMMRG